MAIAIGSEFFDGLHEVGVAFGGVKKCFGDVYFDIENAVPGFADSF